MLASLCSAVLAAVFLSAGVAKLSDPYRNRRTLGDFGAPLFLIPMLSVALPVAELAVGLGMLAPPTARAAAALAAALLVLFMAVISAALARGERPDCNCFGSSDASPISIATVWRNAVLTALAAFVAISQRPLTKAWAFIGAPQPPAQTAVGAIAVICAVATAYAISRTRVRLLAPGKPNPLEQATRPGASGLPAGVAAPDFFVRDSEGRRLGLSDLLAKGRRLVLVFGSADCPSCALLANDVASWRAEHVDRLAIAAIVDGDEPGPFGPLALLQENGSVTRAYGGWGSPEAILISPTGTIESPLVKGLSAIRDLVAWSARLSDVATDADARPRGPSRSNRAIGDAAPLISGLDRRGQPVTLDRKPARETMLLYWAADCEFCREMTPALEAWVRSPPPWAPALVVVTRSSRQDPNLRLKSPVLSDVNVDVLTSMGLRGTPSAVLIDTGGKIASAPARGIRGVMALANGVSPNSAGDSDLPTAGRSSGRRPIGKARAATPFLSRSARFARAPGAAKLHRLGEDFVTDGMTPWDARLMRMTDYLVWPFGAWRLMRRLEPGLLRAAARDSGRVAPHHFLSAWTDCIRLGVAPEDYHHFALWRPAIRPRAGDYISRALAGRLYSRLFRKADAVQLAQLADKASFADYCEAQKTPTPRVLADARYGRMTFRCPRDSEAWTCDLIIKPQYGSRGDFVEGWTRGADGYFSNRDGERLDLDALLARVKALSEVRPTMVQRRVVNDTTTARFSNGALATVRIVTGRLKSGEVKVVAAALKMPAGASDVDNFAKGNIVAQIDPEHGVLRPGQTFADRFVDIECHPDTGARFAGETVAQWTEITRLARDFHAKFDTLALLGFDIAPTPSGPVMIEANNKGDLSLVQFPGARPLGCTPFPEVLLSHLG